MKGKKLLAGILSAAMVIGTLMLPAFADDNNAIVTVKNGSTETGYSVISDALKAVEDNATVILHTSEVDLRNLPDKTGVTYTSDYVGEDGNGTLMKYGVGGFKESIKKITFDGLRFEGPAFGIYGDADVSNDLDITIKNCTFNKAGGNCVYIAHKIGSLNLSGCTFNSATEEYGSQYLVWPYDAKTVKIENNVFNGNKKTKGAIHLGEASPNATVSGNKISGFERGIQVVSSGGSVDIKNNTFENIGAYYDPQGKTAPVFIHEKTAQESVTVNIEDNIINKSSTAVFGEKGVTCVKSFTGNTVDGTDAGILDNNQTTYVAKIGETYYATLAAAINAANDGEIVTLLCDAAGDGVAINKGSGTTLTVDFDGHKYTIDGALAGSPSTVTNGFQLLAGNDTKNPATVIFKNGTITSAKASKLIQNYSNLTLDNMTLDLTTPKKTYQNKVLYTLSNNNGNTVLTGKTNIKAGDGNYAFDVYGGWYPSYPSVTVTLDENMNGTIDGPIEIGNGEVAKPENFNLIIKNGTINGAIVDSRTEEQIKAYPKIGAITGGTFSTDVSAYCADGYVTKTEDGKYTVAKSNLKWETDTDSGYYMDGETKYGMMRFMFNSNVTGTITKSGIMYIKADTLAAPQGTKFTANSASVFQGDIVAIPENISSENKYYAMAYVITEDGGEFWSDPVDCSVNWNQFFTDYNPTAAGGVE